ncbi:glycosyltransferase family 4 protein [Cobetia crustatorum]|uniref:glycosyltransferase family 4 protein n=1 Tax=Cobetia crustatorum TaxID=553385 RepID=UPI000469BED3|nr:glycosyltransferase family 4 protein [Cobetia crustatorum]
MNEGRSGIGKKLAAIAIRQVEKNTGASRNAFEQADALRALGYRVVILAERGKPELSRQHGAELVRLWRWPLKGAFRRFWFNRRVQAWSKRHAPNLLISHGDCESPDTVYLHNCVHLASQCIHGRELPDGHEVAAIHDHVLKGGKFRQVAVNSRMMGEDLISRYGIARDKIEISYPGYDPEQFTPERARAGRAVQRESLGVSDDERLIGLVSSGNFTKRNVAGFVAMAALMEQASPGRYRFLVVGKDNATPYQQQAREVGIEARMLWRSTIPEVETLYGALDLFVLPAHIEEFGRVALEAMACGAPVLLNARVGSAELLDKHPLLVMAAESTAEQWAERCIQLLESDAQALGETLANLARDYSHQAQNLKLKASFEALMAER